MFRTIWVIYNPNYGQSGIVVSANSKASCIKQWETIYRQSWQDNFPNLKCSQFELKPLGE